jgi:hypothetical protein
MEGLENRNQRKYGISQLSLKMLEIIYIFSTYKVKFVFKYKNQYENKFRLAVTSSRREGNGFREE